MYKLLIADDERIECRTLERMISKRFPCLQLLPCVYDGISLIKSIEAYSPDIVIADINMPGLSGLDAIEIMRERQHDIQVIINTAYSDFVFAQRALKCGAFDYVVKPINKDSILHAVERVCVQLDKQRGIVGDAPPYQQEDIDAAVTRKQQTARQPADGAAGLREQSRIEEFVHDRVFVDTDRAERKNVHIKKAMAYIRNYYMKDIALEDVAQECGISSFYMSRMFKQMLDINYVALLTNVRLESALRMLEKGNMSNSDIAKAVGYSSVSYFHKVFKRKTDMTLGDYREAIGMDRGENAAEEA